MGKRKEEDMTACSINALVSSLKQDLEQILFLLAPTFTKAEFQELHSEVLSLDLKYRRTSEMNPFENRIQDGVVALKKDLEMICRREQLQKYYDKIISLESELSDSMRGSHFKSQMREKVGFIKKDIETEDMGPFFCIDEFLELYDSVKEIYSLLSNSMGGRSFETRIRDALLTMKEDIEKDMEPLTYIEGFEKLLSGVMSVRTDTRGQDCINQVSVFLWVHERMRVLILHMYDKVQRKRRPPFAWSWDFGRLYENVSLMVSLLENPTRERCSREGMINKRIKDVCRRTATYLEHRDQIPQTLVVLFDAPQRPRQRSSVSRRTRDDLPFEQISVAELIEEMAYINKELSPIHEDREVIGITVPEISGDTASTAGYATFLNPSQRFRNKDDKLVGLQDDLEKILDCLTGQSPNLKVFPIIGMAGIGKTTFSKELYNHPLVKHRFDTRAWVTVSQEYEPRRLLLGLLSCLTNLSHEITESSNEQLREELNRSLRRKRYLIVLDDVWDEQVWDDLKRALPNDMNGSRILMTSRLLGVATHASPDVPPHCLRCLTEEEGWELLRLKSSANESCPQELLPVGKQIILKCHGLPLAIVVVGGLLSKMKRT